MRQIERASQILLGRISARSKCPQEDLPANVGTVSFSQEVFLVHRHISLGIAHRPGLHEKLTAQDPGDRMSARATDYLDVVVRIVAYRPAEHRLMLAIFCDGIAQRLAGIFRQLVLRTTVLCPDAAAKCTYEPT
jgi:hypothetical protein